MILIDLHFIFKFLKADEKELTGSNKGNLFRRLECIPISFLTVISLIQPLRLNKAHHSKAQTFAPDIECHRPGTSRPFLKHP